MTDKIPDIPKRPEKNQYSVKPAIIAGLVIIVSIFIIRLVAIDFYVVKSNSMNDLLLEGDHIIVSRQSYYIGLPYIRLLDEPGIIDYFRLYYRKPKRDDLIVFDFFDDKNNKIQMIKRIAAVPGDSVTISSNTVKVKSEDFVRLYQFDSSIKELLSPYKFLVPAKYNLIETNYQGLLRGQSNDSLVSDDYYFVLGDNIDFSKDSRNFGLIPLKHIIGKPLFIYWSMVRKSGKKDIRMDRIGTFLLNK